MQAEVCNFIKKETLGQVFSCEFCEISKNTFFKEHLRAIASVFPPLTFFQINSKFSDFWSHICLQLVKSWHFQSFWIFGYNICDVHCVKSVQIRSFFGPYFPAFGLNTDQKKLRIRTFFRQGLFVKQICPIDMLYILGIHIPSIYSIFIGQICYKNLKSSVSAEIFHLD